MKMRTSRQKANQSRRFTRQRGNAILELALAMPLMLVLCVGAADFGRMFYHVVTLVDAANTGASYGALRVAHSGAVTEIEQIVKTAASDVSRVKTVDATASRVCVCPGTTLSNLNQNTVDCYTGSCVGYGEPQMYVRVETTQDFETIGLYPGINQKRELSPTVYRRVQ